MWFQKKEESFGGGAGSDPGYFCVICNKKFSTLQGALDCERQGVRSLGNFRAGNIVVTDHEFGWYNGKAEWIARTRYSSTVYPDQSVHTFFYLVTAVTTHHHLENYHLRTLAMKGAYESGYTNADHLPIMHIKEANPTVLKDARKMLWDKNNLVFMGLLAGPDEVKNW